MHSWSMGKGIAVALLVGFAPHLCALAGPSGSSTVAGSFPVLVGGILGSFG